MNNLAYFVVFFINIVSGDIVSNLLPSTDECGSKIDQRIYGGTAVRLEDHPWLTLLQYKTPYGSQFLCGGVLINKRYVLTAAHCIKRIPTNCKLVAVRLGEHNLKTDPDCEISGPAIQNCADNVLTVNIEKIILHDDYEMFNKTQPNDIALLRLESNVQFTEYIKPICLPTTDTLLTRNFANARAEIAGWGATETAVNSDIKLKVEIPVILNEECNAIYGRANVHFGANQLCAGGEKGKDACSGDSGGPLMYFHNETTNWYTIGIVSFGPDPCGLAKYPGIYTRVTAYMHWIVSNLKL